MKTIQLFTVCALLLLAGCGKDPKIDKVFNVVNISSGSLTTAEDLKQGVAVASGTKIVLSYTNGLGKAAQVLLPDENGLYCDPFDVQLAAKNGSNNGDGTIEIPVSGAPSASGTIDLRPVIRVGEYEVFIKIPAVVIPELAFDANLSTVSGTFKMGAPVDGAIALHYTSFTQQTISVSAPAVSGVSVEKSDLTLPAAPNGGSVSVPVSGTPSAHGKITLKLNITHGDDTYTVDIPVTITGDIIIDQNSISVSGDLIKGKAITDTKIELKYTAAQSLQASVKVDEVNGILCAPYDVTLAAGNGVSLSVPLSGTPAADGEFTLRVTVTVNNSEYTADVPVTVETDGSGIEFVPEKVMFNGLEYWTVFVDLNKNGYVEEGEVWLDRNIGATSNDPGAYGESNINPAAVGDYMQWGRPYGADDYDANYMIDGSQAWAGICPEGYAVPTLDQFVNAIAAVSGGTRGGNAVNLPDGQTGMTSVLINSTLKLPAAGWITDGGTAQSFGIRGGYWTATEANGSSIMWKITIYDDNAPNTGADWADKAWQLPVRCVKK